MDKYPGERRCRLRDPVFGVNYFGRSGVRDFFRSFDEAEVVEDLTMIADSGFNSIRVFVFWQDLMPTYGILDMGIVSNTRRLLDLAGNHQIGVILSPFTVWMNGTVFLPSWLQNAVLAAPEARVAQQETVAALGSLMGSHSALIGFDLGDEAPYADLERNRQVPATDVRTWHHEISKAVNDHFGPEVLVMQPNPIQVFVDAPQFGPANQQTLAACGLHAFPTLTSLSIDSNGHRKAAQQISFAVGVARALHSCVIVDELGAYGCADELAGRYLTDATEAALRAGAIGVVYWCWKDVSTSGSPYGRRPNERSMGLCRADGSPKPQLDSVRKAIVKWRNRVVVGAGVEEPVVEVLLTEAFLNPARSYLNSTHDASTGLRALFSAHVLLETMSIGHRFVTVASGKSPMLLVPSVDELSETDLQAIASARQAGVRVVVSVGEPADGFPGSELGVALEDSVYRSMAHEQVRFADGTEVTLDWECRPKARVARLSAESLEGCGLHVWATFGDSTPAVIHRMRDKPDDDAELTVVLFPLEFLAERMGSPTDQEARLFERIVRGLDFSSIHQRKGTRCAH